VDDFDSERYWDRAVAETRDRGQKLWNYGPWRQEETVMRAHLLTILQVSAAEETVTKISAEEKSLTETLSNIKDARSFEELTVSPPIPLS
jgi:hypothetical protein